MGDNPFEKINQNAGSTRICTYLSAFGDVYLHGVVLNYPVIFMEAGN
jgi:hypothetical protein